MLKKIYQSQYTNRHTLRRIRIVLQSLSGFSFSVSPRLLQLELCFCSSQHTHTPSLSNLSWGGEGENTHPHSCMHATYTETHRHTHTRHTHTHTRTNQAWAWFSDVTFFWRWVTSDIFTPEIKHILSYRACNQKLWWQSSQNVFRYDWERHLHMHKETKDCEIWWASQ